MAEEHCRARRKNLETHMWFTSLIQRQKDHKWNAFIGKGEEDGWCVTVKWTPASCTGALVQVPPVLTPNYALRESVEDSTCA